MSRRASATRTPRAPTAPASLTATGSISSVALNWAAATDNIGVARYNVHRRPTAGLRADDCEPDRAADGHDLHRHGPRGRHLLLQASPPRMPPATSDRRPPEASGVTTGDVTAPSAPGTLTASAGAGSAGLAWGAANDNVGGRPVQRAPVDDGRLHADRSQPHRAGDDARLHAMRASPPGPTTTG